jgi:ribonuclease E
VHQPAAGRPARGAPPQAEVERERGALAEALAAARAEVDELREGGHRAGAQLAAVQAWRQAAAAAAPPDGASQPDSGGAPAEPAERNGGPEEPGARAEDRLTAPRGPAGSGRPRSTKGQHERQRDAAAGRAALRRAVGRAEAAERRLAELDEARVDAARQARHVTNTTSRDL